MVYNLLIGLFYYIAENISFLSGWHHRLNVKAGMAGLGIYRLIPLLRREAELVEMNVIAADLERDLSRTTTDIERRLTDAWDKYMTQEITTSQFLQRVAHLYGPKDDESP